MKQSRHMVQAQRNRGSASNAVYSQVYVDVRALASSGSATRQARKYQNSVMQVVVIPEPTRARENRLIVIENEGDMYIASNPDLTFCGWGESESEAIQDFRSQVQSVLRAFKDEVINLIEEKPVDEGLASVIRVCLAIFSQKS